MQLHVDREPLVPVVPTMLLGCSSMLGARPRLADPFESAHTDTVVYSLLVKPGWYAHHACCTSDMCMSSLYVLCLCSQPAQL